MAVTAVPLELVAPVPTAKVHDVLAGSVADGVTVYAVLVVPEVTCATVMVLLVLQVNVTLLVVTVLASMAWENVNV